MTNPTFFLPAVKNNVTTPQLIGAIGAGDVSLALKTGHGALFPTILRGDCSSTGTSETLNDTGALGSVAVGDYIYNLTDDSWAVVTSIAGAPNSVKTTPLEGGSDNTWQSGDIWIIGMFIATLVQYNADGVTVNKRERVRVTNRVTDTLTVQRGYDGDTAQTFDADDSVQMLIEQSQLQNIQKALRNAFGKIHAINRGQPFYGATTGSSNAYAVTLTPTVTDYNDIIGLPIVLKANFENTGSCTLNVNGLGNKNIRKYGGGTDLSSGDIKSSQIFTVSYDGTQFQRLSPDGQVLSQTGEFFGTGADGSYTLDGTQATVGGVFTREDANNYRLEKDVQFTNLTVNSGINLKTNGYVLRVSGTASGAGKIISNGGNGGNGGNASQPTGGTAGTAGAAAYTAATLKAPPAGVTGGAGGSGFPSISAGSAGSAGTAATYALIGNGVAGGAGGSGNGGAAAGGGGGAAGTATCTNVQMFEMSQWPLARAKFSSTQRPPLNGAAGSGGGGGGGGDGGSNPDWGGGGGGGSGGCGGIIIAYIKIISGTLSFEAKGGNGGNGGNTSPAAGNGGGGSGGSGGVCILIFETKSSYTGTATVTGGSGGSAGTGGNGGSAGSAGNAGAYIEYQIRSTL